MATQALRRPLTRRLYQKPRQIGRGVEFEHTEMQRHIVTLHADYDITTNSSALPPEPREGSLVPRYCMMNVWTMRVTKIVSAQVNDSGTFRPASPEELKEFKRAYVGRVYEYLDTDSAFKV